MSALGQKQTCASQKAMSALLPIATTKADFRTRSCLLYPRKRTCAVQLGMSALGQKRTPLPVHSIIASARCRKVSGTANPSILAVLRLTTSSNFVGCSIGMSAGDPPCNIFTTNRALCRNEAELSAPYDNKPPASAKDRGTVAAGRPYLTARSATALDAKLP